MRYEVKMQRGRERDRLLKEIRDAAANSYKPNVGGGDEGKKVKLVKFASIDLDASAMAAFLEVKDQFASGEGFKVMQLPMWNKEAYIINPNWLADVCAWFRTTVLNGGGATVQTNQVVVVNMADLD